VQKQKEAGADLIKIYASEGARQGGMTLSQEQLNAACDEAKKQGLRTLVHAYREAVRAATAGCTPFFAKTVDGFAGYESLLAMNHEFLQRAVKIWGLKIVFGTDALAGAHGRNAEEFIDRVRDGGVDPTAAMVSANSLGAEALGMSNQIGSIVPGLQADIIALNGDPLKDITSVRRVVFVMKGSIVYKNAARGAMPVYAGIPS